MPGLETLEVVIGILFIYLLLSLFATTINEFISSLFKLRGSNLKKAIRVMVDDLPEEKKSWFRKPAFWKRSKKVNGEQGSLSAIFFNHPLFKKFSPKGKPSYLSKQNFTNIFISGILNDSGDKDLAGVKTRIDELFKDHPESETKKLLMQFVEDANNNLDEFRKKIGQWYEDMVERMEGWYKRKIQYITFFIGLGIAIIFNADTINIIQKLNTDEKVRTQLVDQAIKMKDQYQEEYNYIQNFKTDSSDSSYYKKFEEAKANLDKMNSRVDSLSHVVNLGWKEDLKFLTKRSAYPDKATMDIKNNICLWAWWKWVLIKLLGLTITALAISIGAPFWFDTLNRFVKLRGVGQNPDDKKKQKSK